MVDSTSEAPAAAATPDALTPSERTALLERIVASTQFRRAARLREFLVFVAQHSQQAGFAPLHEQEIGSAVFERPHSYDTGIDNIVRVNATELRKRLDLYFAGEGASEPFFVQMPRGAYTLHFHRREPTANPRPLSAPVESESAALATAEPAPIAAMAASTRASLPTRLWQGAVALLLLVCAALLWQNVHLRHQVSPWRNGAALHSFWSEFLDNNQEVDVVLADTSFAMSEDIEGRSVPLASYLDFEYKHLDSLAGLSPDRREDLKNVLDRNNGSVGDYIAAQQILSLEHATPDLHLKFAREYSAEALKTNSVILIGSRQSNPWVELFNSRMNFTMNYDPVLHRASVHNRQPKAGERSDYVPEGAAHEEGLSIIAFMPGLSRSASALIIAGTNSQATRAAGEFMTSDAQLSSFLASLQRKDFPYFEILLENSELTGTPLRSHVLAYRTYPRDGIGNSEGGRGEQPAGDRP